MKRTLTILEIMVVVVIIGILLGIAVPQYSNYVERSHVGQAKKSLKLIQHAMKLRFVDTHDYEATGAGTGLNDAYGGYVDLTSYDHDTYWDYSSAADGSVEAVRKNGKYEDKKIVFSEDGSCDVQQTNHDLAGRECQNGGD